MSDALLALLLAPSCAACGATLEAPMGGCVCARCWQRVTPLAPPLCDWCGDPLPPWRCLSVAAARCARCRRGRTALDASRAAGAYGDELRRILHALKYEGRRSLARPLGALLRGAGAPLLHDAACAIPVPLHPWRRLRRGFNQASDLAHGVGLPVVPALWRTRATPPQSGLSAAARRRNVRGAFRMSGLLTRTRRQRLLEGQIVLLVDDVRTTGATLEACAEVLKTAGAREVRALTVARALR